MWQDQMHGKPTLTPEADEKLANLVGWVQDRYHFNNLSVFIIGSICSNSWTDSSDIDIDFCAPNATKDDNDEDAVKEFGWAFKKDFIQNYMEKFPEDSKIGTHPLEVYFSPNPFQCFMSIGCYNFLEKKWEVGPQTKSMDFDPVSEYYASAMKQVDKILKDIRTKIFELYELAFVVKKSKDTVFQRKQTKEILKKLEEASKLFKTMKNVRSNFQKPAKSKEEALKRREDKKQHIVDAAFKFLDKFGYIQILKDVISVYDSIENGEQIDNIQIADTILQSVKDNMSLQHLQDSEEYEYAKKLFEDSLELDESIGSLIRLSTIAALMAIPNLLPAAPLAKELNKAKMQGQTLTVNSPATKKAIANAAKGNTMVGQMSKPNVVNAVAQVLWKEARGETEGTEGRKAVASVILNRANSEPTNIVAVLKEPAAFSCLKDYTGGWTDNTYKWYVPVKDLANPENKAIWDECNKIALDLVDKKFKSTIGKMNAYLNKQKADKKNVDSWGKKCTLKIGKHHFGYLPEHDPKYVVPGTMTTWRDWNKAHQPQTSQPQYVVVKRGQTLGKIARDNKIDISKMLSLNPSIKDPNKIKIGQKLRVS